jgi:hypothetical protein
MVPTDVTSLVVERPRVVARREERDARLTLTATRISAAERLGFNRCTAHMKYDHSVTDRQHLAPAVQQEHAPSWVGCQCSSRIAPGATVTSAAEICVLTLNTRESTIFTEPPLSSVAAIVDIEKLNGCGTVPCGSAGAASVSGSASGSSMG